MDMKQMKDAHKAFRKGACEGGAHDEKDIAYNPSAAHPGFNAVAAKIAGKQKIPMAGARAIVAAGARKASPKAIKMNPRLKKVSGV